MTEEIQKFLEHQQLKIGRGPAKQRRVIKQQVKKRSSRLLTEMDSETAQVKLSLSQVVEAVEQKHSLAQARSFKRYSPERS
jgi:hypothetical protein